jgi:hypothetical protein
MIQAIKPVKATGYLLAGVGAVCAALLMLALAAGSTLAATCGNEEFRTGPSANLPNCRAFEQVSPAEKGGQAAIKTGFPVRATSDGSAFEYPSFSRYANSPSGAFPNAYVARLDANSGWKVTNVSPPSTTSPTPPGGSPTTYDFSADLSKQIVKLPLQPLAPGASPENFNLFAENGSGSYSLINSTPPPVPLPAGCPFPFFDQGCFQIVDLYTFAGASSDFNHVIFEARATVLEGFDELFQSNYVNGSWQVTAVGVLPNGEPAPEGATPGSGLTVSQAGTSGPNFYNRINHAISADGSRVIFQAASNEGEPNEAGQLGLVQVYDRLGGTQTLELSAPAPGAAPTHPGAAPATFWAASSDGSRIFFTSSAELTTPSNTGPAHEGNDLYEYDFDRSGQKLVDLTADGSDAAGAQVLGVLDASEDGSYVYFVARAQLDGSAGVAGQPNLYVSHDAGSPMFVATLSEADAENWTPVGPLRESYVTPDGQNVAFTSVNSIHTVNFPTGYNNVNAETAAVEREVYEYSTVGKELFCASCNPSGAPPAGPGLLGGVHRPLTFENVDVSQSSPFHAVRAVSDNGSRVFFSSQDALVQAVEPANKNARVYQWERPGQRDCTTPGGCVGLISGANPGREAVFLDASEEGSDVFLATSEKLVPDDEDGLVDVYDAREGGGFPPKQPAFVCADEVQCGRTGAAQSANPAAATAGFQGPGNPKRCGHKSVKRHGKCVAKKQKHHKKKGHGGHKGQGKKRGGHR